jgi:hypothetical protein
MVLGMNFKQIVMTAGVLLIVTGLIGLVGTEDTSVPPPSGSKSQSSLKVKRGNNLPTSTINLIQGSESLQGQGQQPQGLNAGEQLQPNAGADSLPKNY